jgi:hypothetical protein
MLGLSAVGQVAVAALPSPSQGITKQLLVSVSMAAIIRTQRVLEIILLPTIFSLVS